LGPGIEKKEEVVVVDLFSKHEKPLGIRAYYYPDRYQGKRLTEGSRWTVYRGDIAPSDLNRLPRTFVSTVVEIEAVEGEYALGRAIY